MNALRNERGFSFIEILVAAALLTTGMVAVGSMLMRASEGARFSTQSRMGDDLAAEILENLRAEISVREQQKVFPGDFQYIVLNKNYPGSSSRKEYEDASTCSYSAVGPPAYVERLGVGKDFRYKWRIEDLTDVAFLQTLKGMYKVEVLVGREKCPGPGDPSECRFRTKLSTWVSPKQ